MLRRVSGKGAHSSATFCLTFCSKMTEVMEQANRKRLVMGLISYADDFIVSSDGDEADRVWNETTGALGEIGLEIDQSKSCYTSKAKTGWNHKTLAFKKEIVILGTEATEWNSMAADEQDASLAQKRMNEASEFAGHVEAVAQLHLDSRKSEALWLMTSKSIARPLDFDAKAVNSKKMKPLAETLEAKTKGICEKLLERSLDGDDWTRMKLPTTLGGMGIRAVTSQLEASFDITMKKTRKQAKRIEKSLTGKQRDYRNWDRERVGYEMWDGSQNVGHEDKRETLMGPFQWDLVNASKGHGFSSSISRTLKTHEVITAHKHWSKLDIPEKAAFLANCGQGVGATWTDTAPEQEMPEDEWRTASRRRLRLKAAESKMCECGTFKDERGDHTLVCERSRWRTRIHDRVRDSLARQLRRMGATVDMERVAPQWSK